MPRCQCKSFALADPETAAMLRDASDTADAAGFSIPSDPAFPVRDAMRTLLVMAAQGAGCAPPGEMRRRAAGQVFAARKVIAELVDRECTRLEDEHAAKVGETRIVVKDDASHSIDLPPEVVAALEYEPPTVMQTITTEATRMVFGEALEQLELDVARLDWLEADGNPPERVNRLRRIVEHYLVALRRGRDATARDCIDVLRKENHS